MDAAERSLLVGPDHSFAEHELEGLDEPVRRYFRAAIRVGTPLWRSARLRMRGSLKLNRWLPFRASEVLGPLHGFVWSARVGLVVTGFDRYVGGSGEMAWRLAGLVPLVRASGPDVDRSAAGRCGGEGMWLPTALLPRFGARWQARSATEIVGTLEVGGTPVQLTHRLDDEGLVLASWFDRWGDPDRTGTWGWHRFGTTVTGHRRFGGLTVPDQGHAGWHPETDRWSEGEFFRYDITALEPVAGAPPR